MRSPRLAEWQLWFERLVEGTEAETAATLRDPSFKRFEKRYRGWMGRRRTPEPRRWTRRHKVTRVSRRP